MGNTPIGWLWKNLRTDLLIPFLLVTVSAIFVIYVVHCNRHAYNHLQQTKNELNNADIAYSQLLLQYGTLTAYDRIESLAKQKLGMVDPEPANIILVKP